MRVLFVCLLIALFSGESWSKDLSLIDNDIINKEIIVEDKNSNADQKVIEDTQKEISKNDDLEEMNDFMDQENEKQKSIKLLNLDLELEALELKKKEIEQKIAQLDKSQNTSVVSHQESDEDHSSLKPNIKLVSIFKNETKKQARIVINDVNWDVKEGQSLNGIIIKKIDSQSITIEYEDGEMQDIQII